MHVPRVCTYVPERMIRMSPKRMSVPCAAATALRCSSLMLPVWKGSCGTMGLCASRQLA